MLYMLPLLVIHWLSQLPVLWQYHSACTQVTLISLTVIPKHESRDDGN